MIGFGVQRILTRTSLIQQFVVIFLVDLFFDVIEGKDVWMRVRIIFGKFEVGLDIALFLCLLFRNCLFLMVFLLMFIWILNY